MKSTAELPTWCVGSKSSLLPYWETTADQTENTNFSFLKKQEITNVFKSKIPANPVENFMPDFKVLAGRQTTFSLAQTQCNKIFEISIIPLCKLMKNVSART